MTEIKQPVYYELIHENRLARLLCRPALPSDTEAVMEICRWIWEGHDYVPYVWKQWMDDPDGRLVVAQYGSRLAGFGKLTCLDNDEWWLEGLRVHPDFEGQGVASHIQDYLLAGWQKMGGGAIRLATSSERIAVHKICARTGFRHIAEYSLFSADALPRDLRDTADPPLQNFTRATANQLEPILEMIQRSPMLSIQYGLMDLAWQWIPPKSKYILSAIQNGLAFWWRDDRGLLILMHDEDEDWQSAPGVQILCCQPDRLGELLLDYRRLASELDFDRLTWMAPLQPEVNTALAAAGFTREWDQSLYIFEKWYNPAR